MKRHFFTPWLILGLSVFALDSFGQSAKTDSAKGISTILTVDSLASGSYKDIFTSFFQLAVKDLTGPSKSVTLNTNPYAVMLKHNDSLADYKYYRKYTWLRNLNLSVGAALDSGYRFNGMTAGLTYAIVNNRDYTVKKKFLNELLEDSVIDYYAKLSRAVDAALTTVPVSRRETYRKDYHRLFNDSTAKWADFDSAFKAIVLRVIDTLETQRVPYTSSIRKLIRDPKFVFYQTVHRSYENDKSLFQNRGLLTAGITDTSYSTGLFSKNLQLTTAYIKGLTKPTRQFNIQIDIKAAVNFADDTLQPGRNLNREVFTLTPGLDLVLNGNKSHEPWFEFDVSGSYMNVWKGLYAKETQVVNTINGTVRILVTNDVWIPIQIKYDPKRGNVFGLLNVTTNFTGLGNMVNGNSKRSGPKS